MRKRAVAEVGLFLTRKRALMDVGLFRARKRALADEGLVLTRKWALVDVRLCWAWLGTFVNEWPLLVRSRTLMNVRAAFGVFCWRLLLCVTFVRRPVGIVFVHGLMLVGVFVGWLVLVNGLMLGVGLVSWFTMLSGLTGGSLPCRFAFGTAVLLVGLVHSYMVCKVRVRR